MDHISLLVQILIGLATIAASIGGAKLAISAERRKIIDELRRDAYFDVLKLVTRIIDNPTLVFSGEMNEELKTAALAVDVYGSEEISKKVSTFVSLVVEKNQQYIEEFKADDKYDTRTKLKKNPFFKEALEREEEDYMIENMPPYHDILELAGILRSEITTSIRKG